MITFREPAPPRSRGRRWIAFAAAVFAVAAGVGALAAVTTSGRLDLAAFGIGASARAAGSASAAPTGVARSPGAAAATSPTVTTPSPGMSGGPATPPPSATPSAGPALTEDVDPALAAKLQRALETARRKLALPGVSATVIFPDGSTWTGVSGYAVPSKKQLVWPDTPFAIASVTKTFTAALILRLAEQGRLRLSDPLSKYVPDYPDASKITITMLLRQTSGLQDFFKNPRFDAALNEDRRKVWTPKAVLAFNAKYLDTVVYPPGQGFHYSNTNYLLLGLVAEKAGGANWETLLHREILDPLGLAGITIQGSEQPIGAPAHGNQMYLGADGKILPRDLSDKTVIVPFTSVATAAWSAGALAADSRDLAAWARALYGGNVLTAASRKLMLTFNPPKLAYTWTQKYGMGVTKVSFFGRVAYGHTGALAGTRSSTRWFPREKLAIAVLFNRDGLLTGNDVTRYLVAALYPTPSASPSPAP